MAQKSSDNSTLFDGSHKGYVGRAEYDADADAWHGHVLGITDIVTFVGKTRDELAASLADSVDDYLNFCGEIGHAPCEPVEAKQ